ncbi:hypothetical protein C3420_05990 [Acinetobacter sp. ACNIH3]|nr:hypothetical protein C3420_05990 [Acinetobacter sp. ACNIH3]POV78880.1 hypothetical protein C3421_05515 [Acinetobacter sp. ACNIH4]
MHEYLKFFGTNNQQETVCFLIYERGLILKNYFYFKRNKLNKSFFNQVGIVIANYKKNRFYSSE